MERKEVDYPRVALRLETTSTLCTVPSFHELSQDRI
jgi:hypothetical protein